MRRSLCVAFLLTSACAMTPPPEPDSQAAVAAVEAALDEIGTAVEAAAPAPAPVRLAYPETRRVDVVETQFGVPVADPYRWLENDVREDAEVRGWVEAQNRVTDAFLANLPGR